MAKNRGTIRLDRVVVGLSPKGWPIRLEPGDYEFVVMDGDQETRIATLLDPKNPPGGLLARLPLSDAAEVIEA